MIDLLVDVVRSVVVALALMTGMAYMTWFEALKERGPGQGDPLFPWLASTADLKQMRWFLTQEIAGEAGFDDLVALTQVRLPVRPKLEMASNYWDEMGRGHEKGHRRGTELGWKAILSGDAGLAAALQASTDSH